MNDYPAETIQTGNPLTWLLACTRCGVLLWDIEAHYAHAHPDIDMEATFGGGNG